MDLDVFARFVNSALLTGGETVRGLVRKGKAPTVLCANKRSLPFSDVKQPRHSKVS